MLRNYLLTALRSFVKYKGYTIINVLGLTVGIVSSLLILLWIQDEVQKNRFHENEATLYQVMRNMEMGGREIGTTISVPKPLAEVLEQEYPEIEHAELITWKQEFLFQLDDKYTREEGYSAGDAFFEILSYPLLIGDPATVLDDTYSVVISENLAIKYFGEDWSSDPQLIGQSFKIDNGNLFKITGVFANPGPNSSMQFDFILNIEEFILRNDWVEHWGNNGLQMIAKLHEGDYDIDALNSRVLEEIMRHDVDYVSKAFLQPYHERYLYSNYENGKLIGGRIDYVKIFFVVAIFILVIASINFMNLSTARSTLRAKEIGVRKVLGAQKSSLGAQFMMESVLLTLLAMLISVGIVYVLLPTFNTLTDKNIVIDFTSPEFWLLTGGIVLFTGLLSGSYPAFFLSSFNLLHVLKGTLKHTRSATFFRKGLVVFQFAISILLIIGTMTVYRQIDYIMNKSLGVDKEHVLYVLSEAGIKDHFETYKNDLMSLPEVEAVSRSSQNPLSAGSNTFGVQWEGKDPDSRDLIYIFHGDFDWIETMGIELLEGRDFSSNFPYDSSSYIINETAAKLMEMDDPVGQGLNVWGTEGTIVGLVKDFHLESMYEELKPMVLRFDPDNADLNFIRISGDTKTAISEIEEVYHKYNPGLPFDYVFLDQAYAEDYQSETVIGSLANYFAAIAVFISCLGLLGLASFTVSQRTKEIGVRKVLGASVVGLVLMLSKDFTRLIIIAFVIAAPIAYYFAAEWLDRFEFKADLGYQVFLISGIGAFLTAAITVGYRSARAAMANPSTSLRDE